MTSVGLEPAPRAEGAIESPPSVVGAYRILQLIGQGGMGAVYEAEHVTTRGRLLSGARPMLHVPFKSWRSPLGRRSQDWRRLLMRLDRAALWRKMTPAPTDVAKK